MAISRNRFGEMKSEHERTHHDSTAGGVRALRLEREGSLVKIVAINLPRENTLLPLPPPEAEDFLLPYNTHYSSFKSLNPSSFIFKMSERMASWNPPESWKRITCIMMIRAGHQNKDIMTAAQCSLNTVKTMGHELETCNGDYEDVARRKIPSRRSDWVRTAEFHANLQEKVLKNPGIGIRALSREMNVAASTMKLCTQ
ncbi:hypothetical protein AAG570_011742 [Ranatra chinensis]|uniref:Uncharacterized protein n=1 Tax=Ranatra chinensis TaxID=642074 RepID=A0ABD0YH81_9HEMI